MNLEKFTIITLFKSDFSYFDNYIAIFFLKDVPSQEESTLELDGLILLTPHSNDRKGIPKQSDSG